MPRPALANVSQSMPVSVGNCYLEISRALLNFAIGRASIALPFLNHTRMNKVSPDFCNKSNLILLILTPTDFGVIWLHHEYFGA